MPPPLSSCSKLLRSWLGELLALFECVDRFPSDERVRSAGGLERKRLSVLRMVRDGETASALYSEAEAALACSTI